MPQGSGAMKYGLSYCNGMDTESVGAMLPRGDISAVSGEIKKFFPRGRTAAPQQGSEARGI